MSKLDEARTFFLAQNLILPILERKKDEVTKRMCSEFRSGSLDQAHNVAQVSVLSELLQTVRTKAQAYEKFLNDQDKQKENNE